MYDQRLTGHETQKTLLDSAEEIIEELAAEHYEKCYDADLCRACAEDTPISGEWGPWMGLKTQYDDAIEAIRHHLEELDPDERGGWVDGEFSGVYFEAFAEAAVDPTECVVCTHEIIEADEACGHEQIGETCPADAQH